MRFSLFLACFNAAYKALICLFRRISKNERLNAAIAGFMAGLTIIMDSKDRRMFITVMMLARAIDTIGNML